MITAQLTQCNNRTGNIFRAVNVLQWDAMDVRQTRLRNLRTLIAERFSGHAGQCADALDIKRPQMSRWVTENEDVRQGISESSARAIENKLGLPERWLDNDEGDRMPPGAMPVVSPGRRVWVIGNGAGGVPDRIWGDGEYPVGASDKYAEVATDDPHAFIVAVRGDSMAPRFRDGEYALVEPGAEADLKDDVLVRLKSGETLLKRLLDLRGGVRLGSYSTPDVLTYPFEEIVWIYHVSHALPPRKIKMMVDQVAEQTAYTVRVHDRRRAQQPVAEGMTERRKKHG